jgi:hypothetical protein
LLPSFFFPVNEIELPPDNRTKNPIVTLCDLVLLLRWSTVEHWKHHFSEKSVFIIKYVEPIGFNETFGSDFELETAFQSIFVFPDNRFHCTVDHHDQVLKYVICIANYDKCTDKTLLKYFQYNNDIH